jgi:hypothetical protein
MPMPPLAKIGSGMELKRLVQVYLFVFMAKTPIRTRLSLHKTLIQQQDIKRDLADHKRPERL